MICGSICIVLRISQMLACRISQRLYTTYRHCNMKSHREFVTFLDHRQKSKNIKQAIRQY